MNRRNENATLARDDDGESETPLEQLADEGDSPEGIVLALQDKAHRRELFREALRVVKGKRAKQIVVLYFIHDWPIECNDGSKPDLVHRFNATPREIQYVLAKSMRAMRATLRKGR